MTAAEVSVAASGREIYCLQISMAVQFGDWTVLREWGRRGSPGTMRLESYQRRNEAETAEQRTIKRRLQHGYREGNAIA